VPDQLQAGDKDDQRSGATGELFHA
jgi:hypothetical protein